MATYAGALDSTSHTDIMRESLVNDYTLSETKQVVTLKHQPTQPSDHPVSCAYNCIRGPGIGHQ